MATAKAPARKLPRWLTIVLVALAFVVALIAWQWPSLSGTLRVGTAYGARVACSCRYVGGRSLEDCTKDFEPGMEAIGLSEDPAARTVTASVPLLASATAEFREGWGCIMVVEE